MIGPQDETYKNYAQSLSEDLDILHFDIEPSGTGSFLSATGSSSISNNVNSINSVSNNILSNSLTSGFVEPSNTFYSFNLYPSSDILCRMYGDLIKRFQWKHAAIIYDTKTS